LPSGLIGYYIAFLLSNLTAGVVYLIVALIGVYGIHKFLGCLRPCYNYKKCTFGPGRLAALYFGKRNLKDYKHNYGLGVALFFYALMGPFPVKLSFFYIVEAF